MDIGKICSETNYSISKPQISIFFSCLSKDILFPFRSVFALEYERTFGLNLPRLSRDGEGEARTVAVQTFLNIYNVGNLDI